MSVHVHYAFMEKKLSTVHQLHLEIRSYLCMCATHFSPPSCCCSMTSLSTFNVFSSLVLSSLPLPLPPLHPLVPLSHTLHLAGTHSIRSTEVPACFLTLLTQGLLWINQLFRHKQLQSWEYNADSVYSRETKHLWQTLLKVKRLSFSTMPFDTFH